MEAFYQCNLLTNDLIRLNQVRLFFYINMLTDIMSARGDYIDNSRLGSHGKDTMGLVHRSRFIWPYQQQPPQMGFKFFRDSIQLIFYHDQSWRLRTPLSDWILPAENYTYDCEWFFSPSLYTIWKIDHRGIVSSFLPTPHAH